MAHAMINEEELRHCCNSWGSSHQEGQKIAITISVISVLYTLNLITSLDCSCLSF